MSHIVGVLDPQLNTEEAIALAERMAIHTGEQAPALQQQASIRTIGAAAAASLQNPQWTHSDDQLLTCICGRPVWDDPDINRNQQQHGAAAALAEAYRRFGTSLLEKLHGPFAIAVMDPQAQRVLLAVDRMGICALAWHRLEQGIAFATRADVLTEHPEIPAAPNLQALYSYFYFEIIPSPETFYQGTHKLMPGQCLIYDRGQIDEHFYWRIPYGESTDTRAQHAAELDKRLRNSVEANLEELPIGAFLSGGLDSSTVTGYFSQLSDKTVDVYGIGFENAPGYDEMDYARATARHFGVRLHEYKVKPSDVVQALPKLAAAYDEPFGNASAIPAYYCARMAREDGKSCLLAGDGGDEIFAGNARYAKQKVFQLYSQIPAGLRKYLLDPLALSLPAGAYRLTPLGKLHSYIEQARIPMPERMETYNFLHRTPLDDIFSPEFLAAVNTEGPAAIRQDAYDRADTQQMLKRMLALDMKIVIADSDLRKINRTCELAGIEVRYPMLDEGLVEFAARIPTDRLLPGFRLRDFYKQALKDFLAPETLSKSKHGFGLPFGVWMAKDKELREMTNDNILKFRRHGYVKTAYIDRLLDAHRTEHADYYGVMISRVAILQQWLDAHGF